MNPKKKPSADIEKKKIILLLIGMIVSLGLSLFAFAWINVHFQKTILLENGINFKDEELFDVNITPPTPPAAPVAPASLEVIEIKKNEDPIEETNINADSPEDSPIFSDDIGTGDEIYEVVEVNPGFPGGVDEFRRFLAKNISYPRAARELGLQGKVILQFVVEKDGSVTDINVIRSLGGGTDEEAVRVLKNSPKWNPGMQHGKAVRVKYTIPIIFTLTK